MNHHEEYFNYFKSKNIKFTEDQENTIKQIIEYENKVQKFLNQQDIVIAGRKAWKSLFTEVFDLRQLKDWERTIPKYECDCTNFYLQWKAMNPPQENIGFTWKWKLKNAVNQKLGQPLLSIEEAKAFWANFGVNTDG
jgi:hypothetical protein